ncbi:site-specific DNA-methyltransferase (adenine-specific) [Microbacterium sp. AK009]|uniref:DNA-methyltransferase n=1 Tax=Microbacterium sp. AK009 TaxID=2723068 RepID=UPI00185404C7|nr:site-specific DNA-methyltransferase [Microbacterium sp. AK009]NYF16858.1 site-specific DNA-methyltransferase (adenine-specific) [Microbacterium sp. AK009]
MTTPPQPAAPRGSVIVHHGDNLDIIRAFPDASFTLIYLDPPFNTGRMRERSVERARAFLPESPSPSPSSARAQRGAEDAESTRILGAQMHSRGRGGDGDGAGDRDGAGDGAGGEVGVVRRGFHGREYERLRGDLRTYDDRFDDYWGFLEPRLVEAWRLLAPDGTLYLHLDFREAHYAKVLMDALFGRENFLNELIWAYDYGAKTRRRWPTKHDTILVYVKDPDRYWFDSDGVDREPYMAPGLVTPEKAARGKLPTDVWWHTIVPTTGREKTGYPTQKPEGILRRIVQASSRPGDRVLDFFAGSGTTGAVAASLGRHAVLVDDNPAAIEVIRRRIPDAESAASAPLDQGARSDPALEPLP